MANTSNTLSGENPEDFNKAIDEVIKYKNILRESSVFEGVPSQLRSAGSRDLIAPQKHDKLEQFILNSISQRIPLSLLRLGDGEGNMLFYNLRQHNLPALAKLTTGRIWRVMFGVNNENAELFSDSADLISKAVQNATVIGIPTPEQFQSNIEKLENFATPNFDLRGTIGVIGVWDWLNNQYQSNTMSETIYVNWHVHNSLLNMYKNLVKEAQNISIITCYPELLPAIKRHCNVKLGDTYLIPPQAQNIGKKPNKNHFPTRFKEIEKSLNSRDLQGKLFFVGAGLIGKIYCDIIKRNNGIAIDMGSMLDVLVGKSVRGYQNEAFVQKHKLI